MIRSPKFQTLHEKTHVPMLFFIILCVICTALSGCGGGDGGNDTVKITLLHTADLHNHASGFGPFLDYTPYDTEDHDGVTGAFARIATLIRKIRTEKETEGTPVLLVDSGDFGGGTVYDLMRTSPVSLQFFAQMDYDAITLGEHDFDQSPQGLAEILENGRVNGFKVPVVAANLKLSDTSAKDDALEALVETGVIVRTRVIPLENGINVGIIGIIGGKDEDAPSLADPVTFEVDESLIQDHVDDLKNNQDADIVVVLSHNGFDLRAYIASKNPGSNDADIALARNVNHIDIIASGHAHVYSDNDDAHKLRDETGTIIIASGSYGRTIGQLDITYNTKTRVIEGFQFQTHAIKDNQVADPEIQTLVEQANVQIDTLLLSTDFTMKTPVSKTAFPLEGALVSENGLGNLAADAIRARANAHIDLNDGNPFDISFLSNAIIRADITPGKSQLVSFADIYAVLPMGISPDPESSLPGYPLMSVYLTGPEIRNLCEIITTVADVLSPKFFMNFSGIRFEYDPAKPGFKRVTDVYLYPLDDVYTQTTGARIDLTDTKSLYHIVLDNYALSLLLMEKERLEALKVAVIPKDAAGFPIQLDEIAAHRLDSDGARGIQELKIWLALAQFLNNAFPPTGEGIPETLYGQGGSAMGRIVYKQ